MRLPSSPARGASPGLRRSELRTRKIHIDKNYLILNPPVLVPVLVVRIFVFSRKMQALSKVSVKAAIDNTHIVKLMINKVQNFPYPYSGLSQRVAPSILYICTLLRYPPTCRPLYEFFSRR